MTVEEDKMLHYIGGVAITSIAHDLIFEETQNLSLKRIVIL